MELRLRDASAVRSRRGADDVPRRHVRARRSRPAPSSSTSAGARPSSSSDGADGVRWHDSLDIGSVRLTERFLHGDPPTRRRARRLRRGRAGVACGARAGRDPHGDVAAIGVAGTVTSIAALALGLDEYDRDRVHGATLTAAELDAAARTARRACPSRNGASDPAARSRACAGDRRRRRDRARDVVVLRSSTRSRSASTTSSTAPRSRPPSCRSRKRARRRPAPTPAAEAAARPRRAVAAAPSATGCRRAGRPRPRARARDPDPRARGTRRRGPSTRRA